MRRPCAHQLRTGRGVPIHNNRKDKYMKQFADTIAEITTEADAMYTECIKCRTGYFVPMTPEQHQRWRGGESIQTVIPDVLPDLRELLISGLCPVCWTTTLPPQGSAAIPITSIKVSHDDDCLSLSGDQCNCDVDGTMEVF